jgi:hypothetical protein
MAGGLAMATERQIAANRRNARKSTGPRTGAGKKRASHSSYRHGLRARILPGAERAKRTERLAREFAGASTDAIIVEAAGAAAQAVFDVAQVRQVKVAVIVQTRAVGELNAPPTSRTTRQTRKLAKAEAMTESEGWDEAVSRALPELLTLDRYERRAEARCRRSLRIIKDRKNNTNKQGL